MRIDPPADFDDHEKQVWDDCEWVLHDSAVQRQYAGQVVVVHKHRVWGAGQNFTEAVDAALRMPGCPPKEDLAMVPVEGCPISEDRVIAE